MYYRLLLIAGITLITYPSFANVTQIIDAEINCAITKVAEPMRKSSGVRDITIKIIAQSSPNAFATYGNNIFLSSGLISLFDDPNVVRGVIAHEIGHLKAGHLLQMNNRVAASNGMMACSILLSAVALVSTGNTDALYPIASIATHTNERWNLKHSRENECIADSSAKSFLNKAGYSEYGLIKALRYFQSHQNIPETGRYDSTHPISLDRIRSLELSPSNQSSNENSELLFLYQMASAKLRGIESLKPICNIDNIDAKKYCMAHYYQKNNRTEDAIREINYLVNKYPNYPFFWQKKGELFLSIGSKEALVYYSKALNLSSDAILKIEEAIAKIIIENSKAHLSNAIAILEIGQGALIHNTTIIKYLSLAYDKIGEKGMHLYYRALGEYLVGNIQRSKKIAKIAQRYAGNNVTLTQKIKDIIDEDI